MHSREGVQSGAGVWAFAKRSTPMLSIFGVTPAFKWWGWRSSATSNTTLGACFGARPRPIAKRRSSPRFPGGGGGQVSD